MKIIDKLGALKSLLSVKFFNRRIPLAVRVQVTNQCPNRCLYCNIWSEKVAVPSKQRLFSLLDQLKNLGTKKISFSGGEPMLRDDIGGIIDYCKNLGISPEINSRGCLMEKRIHSLKKLDLLKVSIDGPEEIHDFLSQRKGAFKEAIKAIELATQYGIKVALAATITKYNLPHLDYLLSLAKKYNTRIAFQPLKKFSRGVEKMEHLYPDVKEYRQKITRLIELKSNGCRRFIRNSLAGLKHIYHWPQYPRLKCSAGKLFCIIEPDGTLEPCDRINYTEVLPNCFETKIKDALAELPEVKCSGCGFCGSLELNFLYSFKFGTLPEILWLLSQRSK